MRTTYLTGLVAAAAAVAATPLSTDDLTFDSLGNMIWDQAKVAGDAATNAATHAANAWKQHSTNNIPALERPTFEQAKAGAAHVTTEMADMMARIGAQMEAEKTKLSGTARKNFLDMAGHLDRAHKVASGFIVEGQTKVGNVVYDKVLHPLFPDYQLRITSDSDGIHNLPDETKQAVVNAKGSGAFCDPNVKSVSGYLDVSESRHLWFIFFESRNKPGSDPLVLWLNGGPGCSSSTGLLFELGPCRIANETSVVNNPDSWTNVANIIFLDQPATGVGYSYSDEPGVINNTPEAAKDVYAFLQLFLAKFPHYSTLDFSIAAESYGGIYAPNFASEIHTRNQELEQQQQNDDVSPAEPQPLIINLKSVVIGNGLTAPAIQFPAVVDFACSESNPYHVFDPESQTCNELAKKAERCENLIQQCYKYNSPFICTPAALVCWSGLYSPLQETGLNLYDVRQPCDRSPDKDGPLCYKQMEYIETFLNQAEIKAHLGVPETVDFQSCNTKVNGAFLLHGDSMHDASELLLPLVQDGIRVLIYAGVTDAMCSAIGNERWMANLPSVLQEQYANNEERKWTFHGKQAGTVRSAAHHPSSLKNQFGDLAYVNVFDAGHMVPTNAPGPALDLFSKWLKNEALTTA